MRNILLQFPFQFRFLLIVVLLFGFASPVFGQELPDDNARAIADLKQRLEKDENTTEAIKTEVTAQIQLAEANFAKVEEFKKRIAADQEATRTAAERSTAFAAELKKLKGSSPKQIDEKMSLAEIESEVAAQKKIVDRLKLELPQIEQEESRRTTRRQYIRSQADVIEKQLADINSELRSLSAVDNSFQTEARRIVLRSNRAAYETERLSLSAEQSRYDAAEKENLLSTQRDFLVQQSSQAQIRLTELEKIQTVKRQLAAKNLADSAAKELADVRQQYPLLANSYEINASLAIRVQEVESEAKLGKVKLEKIITQLSKLRKQSDETRRRVATIGKTASVGAMLRKRKSDLPEPNRNRSQAISIKDEMERIQYEKFDVDQQRNELSVDVIIAEIEAANGPQSKSDLDKLIEPINEVIAARNQHLAALGKSLDRLFDEVLAATEFNDRKLALLSIEFREFINERILWIRSNDVLFSELELDPKEKAALHPSKWIELLKDCWRAVVSSPVWFSISSFLLFVLFVMKPRFRREIDRLGDAASRGSCDTFWPTARTVVLSILLAFIAPAIFFAIGYGLSRNYTGDSDLFAAFANSLVAVGWFVLPFEILRRICRPKGLANEHFDWPDSSVVKLRSSVLMLQIPGAVLVFCISILRNLDSIHRVDLVERILFVLGMILIAYFLYRIFHPRLGIFDEFLKANQRSWANQTSVVWFGLIIGVPLSLAGLTVWGYYYTALNLVRCAFATFVFAVIIETGRELVKRLILVQRRHVHIKAARRKHEAQMIARREQIKAEAEARLALGDTTDASAEKIAPVTPIESLIDLEQDLDIDDNAKQANKLVSLLMVMIWAIGLWLIWTDVLPALKALDNYVIYPNTIGETVEPQYTGNGNATQSQNGQGQSAPSTTTEKSTATSTEIAIPMATTSPVVAEVSRKPRVTVRNLLMFCLISIFTLVSAKNLPSAMEMLLLEHLPVDRSFRYAIKSLISYLIVMIGLILAFRSVSISWSSVQWLATALTFGLAFGLQEIFANFVAGIILMFERPIRIGDWITIDQFTGVVTRIRTRATTIVNWDRKEYVIPNKDFITGRLVNWTLSDAINRVEITVGVAYGSDVEKAKKILYDVCTNHPKTVKDPPTQVIFNAFGDSSLNLACRTFIGDIDSRPQVIDQLHTQINNQFNEAGIEISFPQRDLHIRSTAPGIFGVGPLDAVPAETTEKPTESKTKDSK